MTKDRLESLDLAKFLAAIAVIWIHACHSSALSQSTHLARFAVPFFAAAAGYGLMRSTRVASATFFQFTVQRFTRLYLPFLIWSIGYLLFKIAKRWLLPNQDCDLPGAEFFLIGGAYHLWFIPFLISASLALYPFIFAANLRPGLGHTLSIAFAMVGLVWGWVTPLDDGAGKFWVLVGQALPGLFWGCSLGWVFRSHPGLCLDRAHLSLLLGATLMLLFIGERGTYLENVAGVILLLIAVSSKTKTNAPNSTGRKALSSIIVHFGSQAGQFAMGIYFVHLLFLKIGESLLSKLFTTDSAVIDLSLFTLACSLSIAVAWAMSRWKSTRWLVA